MTTDLTIKLILVGAIAFLAFYNLYIARRLQDYAEADRIRHNAEVDRYKRLAEEEHAGPMQLSAYFGLSKASWAVMPRALMQAMPGRWQHDMSLLLKKLNDEFPGSPMHNSNLEITVQAKAKGKFVKLPEALTNYKHPKEHVLQAWRQGGY